MFVFQQDTYTAITTGPSIDLTLYPAAKWSIDVVGNGGTPIVWTVNLEGSLDGTSFSKILQHTDLIGPGSPVYSTGSLYPARYARSRVLLLTLGGASSITASILAAD